METTFISIHDLSEDAITLYSSDSVIDVLGYTPDELVSVPAWELFHPDDLPMARTEHGRRVLADKAAVLVYCRIRDKQKRWIGCECCFSIVYDVMIACTSIYRRGLSSEKRALEAPLIRRIFSSSPQDPRYHMLTHISAKFRRDTIDHEAAFPASHEPRAALFLNRFTRTLTIMYATTGLKDVIGIPAEQLRGRSFYYCIAESCLPDAVQCLENAKGNNSLAYLRFWFRDPRSELETPSGEDNDEEMTDIDDDVIDETDDDGKSPRGHAAASASFRHSHDMNIDDDGRGSTSRSRLSSGESTQAYDTHEAIFGEALAHESSTSSVEQSPVGQRSSPTVVQHDPIELEAVISCASDGLVVCLRRARPMIPHPTQRPSRPVYVRGLFAAPWAQPPILPPVQSRAAAGYSTAFAPSLGPHGAAARHQNESSAPAAPTRATATAAGRLAHQDFMDAIREQAIFAWALTGINGSLFDHSTGTPLGESLPSEGVPIWSKEGSRRVQAERPWSDHDFDDSHAPGLPDGNSINPHIFGDPGLGSSMSSSGTSHNKDRYRLRPP